MNDSSFDRLKETARLLGSRAMAEMLATERRRQVVNLAMQGVQEGRRVMDENAAKVVAALGLATQDDVERVGRRLARLHKRLQRLLDEL